MDRETLIRCELAESAGYRSLYENTRPEVAEQMGVAWLPMGATGAGRIRALNQPLYNRINGLGLREPATESDIDRLIAFFGGLNWAIEIAPIADSLKEGWLLNRGLAPCPEYPKFVRSLDDPLPELDGRVRELSILELPTFSKVMVEAFKMPPAALEWSLANVPDSQSYHFVAEISGQPAGAAFLYVHEGVGWVGGGCVLPEFRGLGLQRGLIAARLARAKGLGCDWATSETGADTPDSPNYSCRNMLACGFEVAYERVYYQWESAAGD